MKLFEETTPDEGIIRLEREGDRYVLWHNGQIVWQSAPVMATEDFHQNVVAASNAMGKAMRGILDEHYAARRNVDSFTS